MALLASLALAAPASAGNRKPPRPAPKSTISLGYYSQQLDPQHASVGASIRVKRREPARETKHSSRLVSRTVRLRLKGGASENLPEPYPPLSINSSLAQNPRPFGPGTFWYPVGPGHVCIYVADSSAPCYRLVGAGAGTPTPGLSPQAIAASVADRLSLSPGLIRTSPAAEGLAGAATWFWLDPAPRPEALTVSLAGETVTARADPSTIEWRFGDAASLSGGPGRAYEPGPPPADAIVHAYQTRCLPGDQGHDPYVLASCDKDGYSVEALVVWRISYRATGPIAASGTLPNRTTASTVVYPVGEARAFLVAGGGS